MIGGIKHSEWYFMELTLVRQRGTVEEYVTQFHKLFVIVPQVSQRRLAYICVLVSALNPLSLKDAIQKALNLDITHT